MNILKYTALGLIILNVPSVVLVTFGETLGALSSYITILFLSIYYFLERKTSLNWWLIFIALSYFLISSFQYFGDTKSFQMDFIKYIILIIGGYELTKRVSKNELFFFLLIGAISIGLESILLTSKWGRYSGFYLNPNVAGFICLFGYSITYSIKNINLKLLGQFIFTLMGFLTFSRTFIVIWVLLNIISLKISLKNIRILGIGVLIFGALIFIDEEVGLNNPRFDQLKNIVNNEDVSEEEIAEDSRSETWALFYDQIIESPFIGNGYGTFSGKLGDIGAHNSYLMIIGEAGIIPFLLFISYIFYLFYWSIFLFNDSPNLIMQTTAFSVFLLANHNFFVFYYVTFAAMWIQSHILKAK